jgi:hypothetical protein
MKLKGTIRSLRSIIIIEGIVPNILKIIILIAGKRKVTKKISRRNPLKISDLTGSKAGG